MQKDIDRLVAQLEDQDRQSRTSKSLETQVQRLEGKSTDFLIFFLKTVILGETVKQFLALFI